MNWIVFSLLAAVVVCAALCVVLARSAIRSALALVVTLFLLSVFYLFLDAPLVAALQVLVYAGAIMVLFLFVIMLLNLQEDRPAMARMGVRVLAGVSAGLFALLGIILLRPLMAPAAAEAVPAGFGTAEVLATQLFTKSLLAFEVTGVLLLVSVIGAVVLAKKTSV
ncbi:MAG TPA: NADH-quinone oxidoreductase subunit J [Terriglobales bacterium]|nr:NADH-quinone oxidoreductase subunit J [Terriglobales bacterium]